MALALSFRPALATDAANLSRLARRSKAHWGYSDEFMLACEAELTVSSQAMDEGEIYCEVALDRQQPIGFYTLEDLCDAQIELGALFVDPPYIGQGVGRQLIERAKSRAARLGARVLTIQGDPHALAFYRAAGAQLYAERESGSIAGRMLPLLRIELRAHSDTSTKNPRARQNAAHELNK
jgi:GNAT superfamily N-acetyltransferase